jgi:hypothetical protein
MNNNNNNHNVHIHLGNNNQQPVVLNIGNVTVGNNNTFHHVENPQTNPSFSVTSDQLKSDLQMLSDLSKSNPEDDLSPLPQGIVFVKDIQNTTPGTVGTIPSAHPLLPATTYITQPSRALDIAKLGKSYYHGSNQALPNYETTNADFGSSALAITHFEHVSNHHNPSQIPDSKVNDVWKNWLKKRQDTEERPHQIRRQ